MHQKEAEFGLPFQALDAAFADTNIYGQAFVSAIDATQQSYHPDVICTNLNPQLNLGFVPFGRQPPCSPGQCVLKKAKQMQERTHFDNAPLAFLPAFLRRCWASTTSRPAAGTPAVPSAHHADAGGGGAAAASSPGSGPVADLCLPQAAGLSQASTHRHHYS